MNRREPSSAALKARAVLRALNKAGFFVHHVSGGHYVLKHPKQLGLRVTLPWHGKDLKRRTLTSIIEQTGLTTELFLDFL